MLKVLQISGFYRGKDKFDNEQYTIHGLEYGKRQNFHGVPVKVCYVKCDKIKELTDADLRKDLYVEYNDRGWVQSAEVK